MCKIDWDIIQKFTDSLAWPILVLVLFLIFKRQITILINRITNDSENIELGGLFKAQLKTVEKIKETKLADGQITDYQTKQLISTTVHIQLEAIKQLGEDYIHANFDQRRLIESQIRDYHIGLTISDMKPLLASTDTGHRIAAAIALEYILDKQKTDPYDDSDVKTFITASLDDSNSFLRYEVLQLVFTSDRLKEELTTKLNEMKKSDRNSAIRNLLKLFIK